MKIQQWDRSIVLGDLAREIIRENYQKIIDREDRVLEDTDPENLHQMRVATRRLRVAIDIFAPAIFLSENASYSTVSKIAKILGKTRDLDVLRQDFLSTETAEIAKFEAILDYLPQKRERSLLKLRETLRGNRYHKLKKSLQIWLNSPKYRPIGLLEARYLLPDFLNPSLCQLFLHEGWFVDRAIVKADRGNWQQELEKFAKVFHSLRKQVKKVRYLWEFLVFFYDRKLAEQIEELKQIQNILGSLQDSFVMQNFCQSQLKLDLKIDFPSLNRQIEQKQREFWQNWQPISQRYLDSDLRHNWHSIILSPIAGDY